MKIIKVVAEGAFPKCCNDCQFCDSWSDDWWTCLAIDEELSLPAHVGENERWWECPLVKETEDK